MATALTIGALLAIILVRALIAANKKPVARTRNEAAAAFANALDLDDSGTHDRFDLFIGRPIVDPELESIRKEIINICTTEGQPTPGRDFGPLAEAKIREMHARFGQDAT